MATNNSKATTVYIEDMLLKRLVQYKSLADAALQAYVTAETVRKYLMSNGKKQINGMRFFRSLEHYEQYKDAVPWKAYSLKDIFTGHIQNFYNVNDLLESMDLHPRMWAGFEKNIGDQPIVCGSHQIKPASDSVAWRELKEIHKETFLQTCGYPVLRVCQRSGRKFIFDSIVDAVNHIGVTRRTFDNGTEGGEVYTNNGFDYQMIRTVRHFTTRG